MRMGVMGKQKIIKKNNKQKKTIKHIHTHTHTHAHMYTHTHILQT